MKSFTVVVALTLTAGSAAEAKEEARGFIEYGFEVGNDQDTFSGFSIREVKEGEDAPAKVRELLDALKLAQTALNIAKRFKIPNVPSEFNDSYKIAAIVDKALREYGQ